MWKRLLRKQIILTNRRTINDKRTRFKRFFSFFNSCSRSQWDVVVFSVSCTIISFPLRKKIYHDFIIIFILRWSVDRHKQLKTKIVITLIVLTPMAKTSTQSMSRNRYLLRREIIIKWQGNVNVEKYEKQKEMKDIGKNERFFCC